MADATPKSEIPAVKLVPDVPVLFADGIQSQSYGFGVVKTYFSRYDADPALSAPLKETTLLQLVMPVESFVRSVSFLKHRVAQMVAAGAITQAFVDECNKYWIDNPDAGKPNA